MAVTLGREVAVATCIACGARSRPGECEDGCVDVALDLVEVADVEAARARAAALEARVGELRAIAEAVAEGGDWDALRERARGALHDPAPEAPAEVEIVEAWGCPRCGRVDAPQPCLGVCIRRPVPMIDASAYRVPAARAQELAGADGTLSGPLRLVAQVTPRAGQQERTIQALRTRVRDALSRTSA